MKFRVSATALLLGLTVMASWATDTATKPAPGKKSLAVLPFVGGDDKDKELAQRMRFAVSQKLSNDADGGGRFERMDNVKVEQIISGLQIPWAAGGSGGAGTLPDEDDLAKVFGALETDQTIAGIVKGRKLTLILFEAGKETRRASVEIPSNRESPKLAVEQVLTELTGAKFVHIRDVEADHSNPAVEARWTTRPNLVADGNFESAVENPDKRVAKDWDAILGPDHYPPPLISAAEARTLKKDRVAVVPKSFAGDSKNADGHCLLLRLGKYVAENNGLACISTWIPVESGKKYRFSCKYFSKGPTTHLFINGYAVNPDKYGDKNDPEAVRRQYYRAQVAPTKKNAGFELMEMDFTPSSLKPTDPKIEWIRVDLYAYLHEGDIFFDDVIVKKIDE